MKNRWQESSLERKSDFFKVLIGDFEQRLRIPLAYVKQLSQESSEAAIIEGPSGSCWHVQINKTTNDMYLQEGWEEFSRAHSLREGEFLVFKHCGNMHFKVKIFDKSACEREDAFKVKCSQEPANFQGNKRKRPLKSPLEPSHLSHHSKKRKNDCILEQKCPYQGKRGSLIPKPSRTVVTRGTKEKEAAYSFTSSFPYFEAQIKAGPPFHVMVPVSFSRLHLPSVSTEVTLLNQEGKIWMVNFLICSGKHLLDGGWDSFFRANNLKNGDYCVFELVDELEMKVHVFGVSSQMSRNSIRVKEETHEPSMGKGWRIVDTSLRTGKRGLLPKPSRIMLTQRMEAKEAAYSFTSLFPYFVIQMKVYNVGPPFRVTVPAHFSRSHLPSVSTKVALRNQEGKIWMVSFHFYPASRQYFLYGGWRAFSCANNLKNGDYCVFERVHELNMQVHTFRVSKMSHCRG